MTRKSATELASEAKFSLTGVKRPTAAIVLYFVSIYRIFSGLSIPFGQQYPHLKRALAQTTWVFRFATLESGWLRSLASQAVAKQSHLRLPSSHCIILLAMANQSPMISIPKKSTDEVDWTTPIRNLISQSYGENPDNYAAECAALQRCRQDAVRGAGSDTTGNYPRRHTTIRD